MKRVQREVYQIVANEADFSLCSFCKFAEFSGDSCCDGGGDIECHHPLCEKSWDFDSQVDKAMDLGDCWGFRPRHDISFIADIIGITLAKGWDGVVSWWQDKEENWHITGTRILGKF